MKRFLLPFLVFTVLVSGIQAQDAGDKWSLQRCVDYAAKNNISVKQADVQARLAKIEVERAKLAQYPNVGFSTNVGTQYGRSIDPTTNQFTSSQLLFQNLNVTTGVSVFGWGALQSDKKIAAFNANAALTDIERIINDVSISVATFYLQVIAAKKQIEIAEVQILQTKTQLAFTRKRVDAGALPELNAAEIEAQLARDTTTLVNAQASYEQALIQLKAAINLDMATPFEIDIPEIDKIPLASLADLDPAILFQIALNNQPAQKAAILRVKSAEESVKRAKTAFYPT
ncbi:MAG: TolC family protein, partial [Sediminibacterium sp.]